MSSLPSSFQSQRRFFGGSNLAEKIATAKYRGVSIAEAILWGEQLQTLAPIDQYFSCFNRRGDSLGGATDADTYWSGDFAVSIAEEILWGDQQDG